MFERFDPPYDDPADPNELLNAEAGAPHGGQIAQELAERKAASVPAKALQRGALPGSVPGTLPGAAAVVLTADTVGITPDGGLVGTPQTAEQARAMLGRLMGATHTIATGVALRAGSAESCSWGELRSFHDLARVTLGRVDPKTLEQYLDSGQWAGKAGGYNLAERMAAGWPITVEGDPGTVMGLPMRRLAPLLVEAGVHPQASPGPCESAVG